MNTSSTPDGSPDRPPERPPAGTIALIVDDEPDIRQLAALTLERIGVDTHTAANLAEARRLLETYSFDVCLTDLRLPDGNGLELVRHVHRSRPSLPIAVITAHGDVKSAVEAMKNGAFDFVSKPLDINRLRRLVAQAVRGAPNAAKSVSARTPAPTSAPRSAPTSIPVPDPVGESSEPDGEHRTLASLYGRTAAPASTATDRANTDTPPALLDAERLVGESPIMQTLRTLIAKVARSNAPVWITGESGTGKEVIARLIHSNGPRADAPFVAINCGAIPYELMESELFGHRKGSFTGATADKEGLFQRADGGTLLLDEIAELPMHMQVKLLRAVQEHAVRAVGGDRERPVDVRILSASHADPSVEVQAGRFRQDLYYRLDVIALRAPSLRERPEDIEALARHVLARLAPNGQPPAVLAPAALTRLRAYHFPGNVRELENLLERAVALSEGNVIGADDLVLRPASPDAPPPPGIVERRARGEAGERQRFIDALEAVHWNRKAAAASVGLTYRQFRYRLALLGIAAPTNGTDTDPR